MKVICRFVLAKRKQIYRINFKIQWKTFFLILIKAKT